MLTDGLWIESAGPLMISDIKRLMFRNILDAGKFVFTEIRHEDLAVLIREVSIKTKPKPWTMPPRPVLDDLPG